MNPCRRGPAPEVLAEYGVDWTTRWTERRRNARASGEAAPRFSWPTVDRTPANHHLLPPLRAMTEDHCAYCDGFPVAGVSLETIDHFRPKSVDAFEHLAFE